MWTDQKGVGFIYSLERINLARLIDAVPSNTSLVVVDFDAVNPGPVAFVDG